jgi:hypothetical protein
MTKLLYIFFAAALFLAGCSTEEPVSVDNKQLNKNSDNYPVLILLPDGFEPEGIESGKGSDFFVGSLTSGAIYKGDFRTGEGAILVPGGSGRISVGLSFDERSNYLFVAGGETGVGYVYHSVSGALLATYNFGGIMINDVVVTKDAAYFTESYGAVIYKVPLGPGGSLPSASEVEAIPLGGEYEFIPNATSPFGINNNGIEATPNGKTLFINNMANGILYKVDAETGIAVEVDLGGALFPFGDGLYLRGHTLYFVQNITNQVVVIRLDPDLDSGTIVNVISDDNFAVPATITGFGSSVYVVNARFTLPPGPFYVVKVSE